MALLQQALPAPIGGVSQVDPRFRAPDAVAECVNMLPLAALGLCPRRGSRFVAELASGVNPSSPMWTTEFTPRPEERYLVVVANSTLYLVDLVDRVTVPVFANALLDANPTWYGEFNGGSDYRAAAVGNRLYLSARHHTPVAAADVSPTLPYQSLIEVTAGAFATTYTVFVDFVHTASYTVPAGPVGSNYAPIDTTTIATNLKAALVAALPGTYTVTQAGPTILVSSPAFLFTSTPTPDVLKTYQTIVNAATELPAMAPDGYTLLVAGDPASEQDDAWMVYSAGRWSETVGPAIPIRFEPRYMPWVLELRDDGAFEFGPIEWGGRTAGNLTNNPWPSFIGRRIDALFVHRARLGFLADGGITLSRVSDPTTLLRTSAALVLDDDAIDVTPSQGDVGAFYAATEWDGDLILWSERGQTRLSAEPALTARTIRLDVETRYESCTSAPPVVLGSHIAFARCVGDYTRVHGYYRPQGFNMIPVSDDATVVVPTYLNGRPVRLVSDASLGVIVVQTDGNVDGVSVANVGRRGEQAVYAWHRWQFPGATVKAITLASSQLVLLVTRGTSLVVETVDMGEPADPIAFPLDAQGGAEPTTFTPSVNLSPLYFRDKDGMPEVGAHFVLRSLSAHYTAGNDLAATFTYPGRAPQTRTVEFPLNSTGTERYGVLGTSHSLGVTLTGSARLTGFLMEGTLTVRARRL